MCMSNGVELQGIGDELFNELLLALGVQPAPVSSGGADAAAGKENGGGVVDENARIPLETLRRHRAFAAVAPPVPNRSHL